MNKIIILVRHAETPANIAGTIHAQSDPAGLTDAGRLQVEALTKGLKDKGIKAVYSSVENRSLQTARPIGEAFGVEVIEVPDIRERNWGEWSGQKWEDIKQKLEAMSLDERYTFVPPGGESWEQMDHRLRKVMDEIVASPHDVVAIVTHQGAMRALMPMLLNQDRSTSFNYEFANGSITILSYDGSAYHEVVVNDISHLS